MGRGGGVGWRRKQFISYYYLLLNEMLNIVKYFTQFIKFINFFHKVTNILPHFSNFQNVENETSRNFFG